MSFIYIFLSLNIATTVYFGVRIYSHFSQFFPLILQNKFIYGALVFIFSQFYLLARFLYRYMNETPSGTVLYSMSTVMAVYSLMLIVLICFDLFLLAAYVFRPVIPLYNAVVSNMAIAAASYICIVAVIYAISLYMAAFTKDASYNITVDKPLAVEKLRIVQISDLHVASFTKKSRMEKLVDRINSLDADIIVVTGDLLDGEQKPFYEKDLHLVFSGLNSTFGVYSSFGNHEYYGEGIDGAVELYERSNLGLLRDELIYIEGAGITIAGRDDVGAGRFGFKRMEASELLSGVDFTKPVIVLDHQPHKYKEAMDAGADLQLSGHTHNGQIFPANFIVKAINEKAWGLLDKGAFKLIVSCGVGTWGPPIRLGSYSEIVVIDLISSVD